MKARIQTNPHIANDNGRSTRVVSSKVRQGSLMREWAPAILATFFTVDRDPASSLRSPASTSDHAMRTSRRGSELQTRSGTSSTKARSSSG